MKRVTCFAAFIAFIANTNAQYVIKRNLPDFSGIKISTAAKVNLIQSDSNYVTISSKDSLKETPKIDIKGGVFELSSSFKGRMDLHVKNITSIAVSDGARLECEDTLKSDNFTIYVSDAGTADILIHAKTIKARANDAGSVTLSGNADSLDVESSDASHVNSAILKANSVRVVSSDGSNVAVMAIKSIDANATDGSTISILGNPSQKNTSASDGGSINTYNSTWMVPRGGKVLNLVENDTDYRGKKVTVITGDAFIGGGFVMGGSNGVNIKYGSSREFIMGFGGTHAIIKHYLSDLIGLNIYYKSTDFFLAQKDSSVHHQSEKISLQNFGGLVFDRLWVGKKSFVDAGIYGDWTFHSKFITWDNNTSDVASTKTIERNLTYVNSGNYGLTFRYMCTYCVLFYFNYRLSPVFQNSAIPGYGPSQLPNCVLGITFGF